MSRFIRLWQSMMMSSLPTRYWNSMPPSRAMLETRGNATLKILGLDIFRAAIIAPDLIGIPAEDRLFDILADDAIFLSPAAMEWLKVKQGDP